MAGTEKRLDGQFGMGFICMFLAGFDCPSVCNLVDAEIEDVRRRLPNVSTDDVLEEESWA